MADCLKTAWEDAKNVNYFYRSYYYHLTGLIGDETFLCSFVIPGTLVDTSGTLYWALPSLGKDFAGKGIWVGKVSPTGERTQNSYDFSSVMEYYTVSGTRKTKHSFYWYLRDCVSYITGGGGWFGDPWIMFAPCIAQETKASDYFHTFASIMPTQFWDGRKGIEGLCFFRIKKSDLTLDKSKFLSDDPKTNTQWKGSYWNFRTSMGGESRDVNLTSYNRNIYTAIYDVDLNRTILYWLNPFEGKFDKFTRKPSYNYKNDSMQCSTFDNEGSVIKSNCCDTKYNFTFGSKHSTIEPRIEKMGDYYYFLLQSHTYPYLFKLKTSNGDISKYWYNTWASGLEDNDPYYSYYHGDMHMLKENTSLNLSMNKITQLSNFSTLETSKARWANDKFAPWNKNHILLTLSSWVETNGTLSADSPPENTFAYFPVDKAIIGDFGWDDDLESYGRVISPSHLYLNTHKFVTYSKGKGNYVIYAYCYPGDPNGNKTQLFLGVSRYSFDDKGHIYLGTKREFKQRTSKTNPNTYTSFGNLTNCSRIISMDVKNGHLWIVFASADEKLFYYFYAKADDIIKFAPY